MCFRRLLFSLSAGNVLALAGIVIGLDFAPVAAAAASAPPAPPASTGAVPNEAEIGATAAKIPVTAFFADPKVSQPQLSPDGTKIAFLFPHEGRRALGVFDRATHEARLVLRGSDESLDRIQWKGNAHVLFAADFEGNESDFVGCTDLSGKRIRRLTESFGRYGRTGAWRTVIDWLPHDPEHVVLAGWFDPNDRVQRVASINVLTGKRTTLFAIPEDDSEAQYGGFVVDGSKQVRFATVAHGREVRILYRDRNNERFEIVHREKRGEFTAIWGGTEISADGKRIYAFARDDDGHRAVREFDPVSRRMADVVFQPGGASIHSLIWSADGNSLDGVLCEAERLSWHWLNPAEARVREQLQHAFPGLEVTVVSRSADDRVRLVHVGSDRHAGVYFVLDRTTGRVDEFKAKRPDLDARYLRPMESIAFDARDGLRIHGYLTRPWNASGRKVPLVLLPHGGPFGMRDSWGFDPEVQFLASRGYAVLQVNYRGSGGYGGAFLNRGRRQWGRAMQDDLTDAVRWAIAEGIADPARVAIYGASYGGYAALIGAALTPELYCCAANYVGAADLEITGHAPGSDAWRNASDFDFRNEWIGATKEERDAVNPVRLVDRIKIPTLHAYGRNDPRVSYEHWERLERQLKKYGKPYEIIFNKRAGHGFDAAPDAIAFYTALEKFFARHLAGSRQTAPR